MALFCKDKKTCLAGKRLSRKKLVNLIPDHEKYIEPFAGNAWVYREGIKQNKVSKNAVLNDINCTTTKYLDKEFPGRYVCGRDYKEIINHNNKSGSFFFLDPPYPNSCKLGYYGKHCDVNHDDLRNILNKIKGKFMLTTSIDQRPKFCKDFKCQVITSRGMFGRPLRDLVVRNYSLRNNKSN